MSVDEIAIDGRGGQRDMVAKLLEGPTEGEIGVHIAVGTKGADEDVHAGWDRAIVTRRDSPPGWAAL